LYTARRIAANIAKLPELLRQAADGRSAGHSDIGRFETTAGRFCEPNFCVAPK